MPASLQPAPLPDDLAAPLLEAADRLGPFAGRVLYFDRVESTNDLATRLATLGAEEGTTVVAGQQTAGRGRHGRVWFSPPDSGLYVSGLFRPSRAAAARLRSPGVAAASFFTLMAGVALAEAILASTGLQTQIKWPNDLVVEDGNPGAGARRRRKIAGILTEGAGLGPELDHVIVGFGINVGPMAYPRELMDKATSLETELGRPADRGAVLVEALAALARWYRRHDGDPLATVLPRWRTLAPSSRGAPVRWVDARGPREGRTEGIDRDGALLVRGDRGLERIVSGEVTWL